MQTTPARVRRRAPRVVFALALAFAGASTLTPLAAVAGEPPVGAAEKQRGAVGTINRWLDVQTAQIGVRWRYIEARDGSVRKALQHQEMFKFGLKFDPAGRFSLNTGIWTGPEITSSWNYTGWGYGDSSRRLYVKTLYLDVKPYEWLELQAGGLPIARGTLNEITSYDTDAYIMGERLVVRAPKKLFFDDVTVSRAYLGDYRDPSIRNRFDRLESSNYHQVLATRAIRKRGTFSLDYTVHGGAKTLRQGMKIGVCESRVLDSLQIDAYERVEGHRATGMNVSAEKVLRRRLTIYGGFASVDPRYGQLNADAFYSGKRFYLGWNVSLTPEFTVSSLLGHAVGEDYTPSNRTRFIAVLNFNALKAAQRAGLFTRK